MINKIGNAWNTLERRILISALVVMVIVSFMQVVMRYVFNDALSWSEEVSRYLFVWFSWIGVSVGLKENEHLSVELFSISLKRHGLFKTNEATQIVMKLIWLATTLIVAYYGIEVVKLQMSLKVVTPAIRMPVWIGYLSVPIASSLVGIRLIVDVLKHVGILLGKFNHESEVAN